MIHKWKEIRDKMSPERLAKIDSITEELKKMRFDWSTKNIFLLSGRKWEIRFFTTKTWFSCWQVKGMTYLIVCCRLGLRLDLYDIPLDL
jgi:hypothetical protein